MPKDSPRVEVYGTLDELSSYLGVIISRCRVKGVAFSLKEIQRLLFVAGADLASEFNSSKVPRITPRDTLRVEKLTDDTLKHLPALRNFILPGGAPLAAELHFARAICRRAERRLITASKSEKLNPELIPFLNRLSSYLYNLARLVNARSRTKEEIWKT